jgi:hypothetical protein
MGLLDDAIREHLELKRRHGADPHEVARQEQEALGPARRSAEPAVAEDTPPEEVFEEPEHAFEESIPEFEPEPGPEPVAQAPEPPVVEQETQIWEPVFDDEDEQEPVAETPLVEQDTQIHEPVFDEPEPEPQPRPRRRAREPEPEPELEPESEATEDDVLEGTPEFLEETPEHDRLWFEQRPPRDFDFDD